MHPLAPIAHRLLLLATLGLTACGGGGDGPASSTVLPAAATPASITAAPQAATVSAGQTASFSVTAAGSAPLSYQWLRNGSEIAGAASASYTLTATATDDGAAFSVRVGNAAGIATSTAALLTVLVAPALTQQPADLQLNIGQPAPFTVAATGSAPLAYQWLRNEIAIAGATTASYTLATTTAADHGARFSVRISNAAGSVTSRAALLQLSAPAPALAIQTQPAGATVLERGRVTLSVAASGTALRHQWRRNGVELAGATAASLVVGPVTAADDGARYSVQVSDANSSLLSAEAVLRVGRASLGMSTSGVLQVAAIDADGRAWTWLGTGPYTGSGSRLGSTTIESLDLADGRNLSLHALAGLSLQSDGSVRAWGQDFNLGLLGQGLRSMSLQSSTPLPVQGASGAVAVSAGSGTQYAVRADGSVLRWGVRDIYDSINNRLTRVYDSQALVDDAFSGVRRIEQSRDGGSANGYALRRDGTVLAWGLNAAGQLGDGSTAGQAGTTGRFTPAAIPGLTQVVALAATGTAAYAVRADGTVWSWGTHWLGFGSATERVLVPTQVAGITDAIDVYASERQVAVLRADGSVLIWGYQVPGTSGGRPALVNSALPLAIAALDNVVHVVLGWDFGIALRGDGSLLTWGPNRGQTGGATSQPLEFAQPTPVLQLDLAP